MSEISESEIGMDRVGAAKPGAAVDVVFLHGIGGDPYKTWTGGSSDQGDFWPASIDAALPQAQVWTAYYPARIRTWFGPSFPLRQNAVALLDRLSQKIGKRPIIFVCHSLGGLVAKQIFRVARDESAPQNLKELGDIITGFVFLGTPHHGSSLASLADALVKVLGRFESLTGFTQSANELAKENAYLDDLADWFRSVVVERGIAVSAYGETRATKGVLVVQQHSANPTVPNVKTVLLPLDHSQLAGPHEPEDQIFDGVLSLIRSVAERPIAAHPPAKGFSIDIGVTQSEIESWSNVPEDPVIYSVQRLAGETKISFELAYLDLFRGGGPIRDVNYLTPTRCPFRWDYPALDLKFINNTDETVYLTEAVVEVEESTPIAEPLFAIRRDVQARNAGVLILVNEGWTTISELTLDFNITPGRATELLPNAPPYAHSLLVADLEDRLEIDVTPAFAEAGVDIEDLIALANGKWTEDGMFELPEADGEKRLLTKKEYGARVEEAFGGFQDQVGTFVGEIRYRATGAADERAVKFQTFVYLANANRLGIRRPLSFQYQVALEIDNRNYTKTVALSQEMKPGDTDWFALKIAAPQSSAHRFRLKFRDSAGKTFPSGVIALDCFVPRSRGANKTD